jgi:hypothetical protein
MLKKNIHKGVFYFSRFRSVIFLRSTERKKHKKIKRKKQLYHMKPEILKVMAQ